MGIAKAYFGDKEVFDGPEDIKEHVEWLLPTKDADESEEANRDESEEEEEGEASVEEVVRRRKKKFAGAPFLWENGLIGPSAKIRVRKYARSGSYAVVLILILP